MFPKKTKSWFSLPLAVLVLAVAPAPVVAHDVDGTLGAATTPPATAAVETFKGTIDQLIVTNQITGQTSRYVSLRLDAGGTVALSGPGLDALVKGARVEASGRRADGMVFVTGTRALAPAPAQVKAQAAAQASGTLFIVHADDFANGKGTYSYVVRADDGAATQLQLAVLPDALKPGMQVVVSGTVAADGFSLEPSNIIVISLPAPKASPQGIPVGQATTNNTLVMMIKFTDSPASDPFTPADVDSVMRTASNSVTAYYNDVSYGQHLINTTIAHVPPALPACDPVAHPSGCWLKATVATPAGCNYSAVGSAADAAATAAGYNPASYQNKYYVTPYNGSCGWAGLAYVGLGLAWSNGYNALWVYGHELGHNFGLWHSGSMSCPGQVIGGPSCSVSEYGDPYDVMGNIQQGHFNAAQKSRLGWIATGTVNTHVSGSATYTLAPLETSGAPSYAVTVPAATTRTYWLDYRSGSGLFDAGFPNNGTMVRVASPFEVSYGSDDTEILAMHPGVSWTLDVGQSFTDRATGTTFNVLSKDAAGLHVSVTKVNVPMLGDFNNDAYSDLLWQSPSTSQGSFWFMKTGAMSSSAFFSLPAGWLPQGVGDFNGDGKADIVWTNPGANLVAIWFMNGSTHGTPPDAFFGVPNTWSIAAVGDFNGDGKADILWRNVNGQIASWLMNGSTIQSVVYYSNVDASWSVLGTGDFDGNGKSEVVWIHQPDGTVYFWRNVDQTTPQLVSLGVPGGSWQVAAIGDFDGDGKSDLFLRDASGNNAIWKSGLSTSAAFPPGVPTAWSVMSAKQLYGDGTSTLLWRRTSDGLVAHWRFDPTLASPTATFLTTVPLNWSKVGQ